MNTNIPHNTTFILGFWYHEKNIKRNLDHYFQHIPDTFALLKGCKIVFYYEQDFVLDFVIKHVQTQDFKAIKIAVKDLPTYNLSADYLNSCINQDNEKILNHEDVKRYVDIERLKHDVKYKQRSCGEKGITHYNRDYTLSGIDSYRHIITVWTSKVHLMNYNTYNTEYVAWVDVSFSRFNSITQKIKNLPDTESFLSYKYDANILTKQGPTVVQRYYGEPLSIIACFMRCSKKLLSEKILPLYVQQLHRYKDSNYAHDEETILHLMSKEYPEFFNSIELS